MSTQDISATTMVWKPKLIRLTYASHSAVANGVPQPCYVDPSMIASITRQVINNKNPDGQVVESLECTIVGCCHFSLYVEESPDVVAAMRDRALGFEPTLSSVSS